jgi:hypothetical protein
MQSTNQPEWLKLYHEAYDRFGILALWSYRRSENPTPAQALSLCGTLRRQGDMSAWRLADRLAKACHAA